MRQLTILALVLALCGFAAAQATVIGGTASNWVPSYGVYAAPFVPRVVTPSVTLESVSPDPVGASNATFGNVAGATNATLSIVNTPQVGVYTVPVWYGPNASSPVVVAPLMVAPEAGMQAGAEGAERHGHGHARDFTVSSFQYSQGLSQLLVGRSAPQKASKTYTNEDVDRFNQSTGKVKYDGKSEEIH
ncbi:MAG: hypothetical protein LAO03_08220 [Acidobacteriia bacterium]|nr:hypothetical protein [Terriglobia bacterium]